MQLGLIRALQWCDARDMTADGHTKGCIDRKLLMQVMSGELVMEHPVKTFSPYKQRSEAPAEHVAWSRASDNDHQVMHGRVLPVCWT